MLKETKLNSHRLTLVHPNDFVLTKALANSNAKDSVAIDVNSEIIWHLSALVKLRIMTLVVTGVDLANTYLLNARHRLSDLAGVVEEVNILNRYVLRRSLL
jgi:hypothetical protein